MQLPLGEESTLTTPDSMWIAYAPPSALFKKILDISLSLQLTGIDQHACWGRNFTAYQHMHTM
jgi:hypothetical protein